MKSEDLDQWRGPIDGSLPSRKKPGSIRWNYPDGYTRQKLHGVSSSTGRLAPRKMAVLRQRVKGRVQIGSAVEMQKRQKGVQTLSWRIQRRLRF
jgi:hypothetical protein